MKRKYRNERKLVKKSSVISKEMLFPKSRVVDDIIHPCLYCGLGFLDETAIWYGGEKCNGWVHQICEENFKPVTDDEPVFRKFCLSSESKTGNDEENEAIKARPSNMACYDYVAAQYRKCTEELEAIEVKTREQSKCDLWFSERSIMASLFGGVLKDNKPETMKKIALDITHSPPPPSSNQRQLSTAKRLKNMP
ncbi:hypothetical protein JTB14_000293 [Gonioctena quinquepunctata]|nr:hypothetical protein JTB14_000293 [Gonioctena quinquepunctata]